MSDLNTLAADDMQGRLTGSEGAAMARDFIIGRFSALGLEDLGKRQFLHPFIIERTGRDVSGINVLGVVRGHSHADLFIVVTAHYDHIGTHGSKIYNGADDNASGVAAMLALASDVKRRPLPYSVIFLATDAEEIGLYGAKAFVASPPVALQNIVANLNLDMLGQGRKRYRLFVSGVNSHPAFRQLYEQTEGQGSLCMVIGHRDNRRGYLSKRRNYNQASDHGPFLRQGIPYLFLGVSEHAFYHTPHDTADSITPAFYQAAAEASLIMLRLLGEVEFRPRPTLSDAP